MNLKNVWPLAVAVVLGLVAAVMVQRTVARSRVQTGTKSTATMVVVQGPIAAGHELTAEDLTVVSVPPGATPDGSFKELAELNGRVTKVEMVRGQPVLETLLAPTGTPSGAAVLVPGGMRAITLAIDEFSGVAGMLSRGCRVDLISVIPGENTGAAMSRTVVQNVQVLAVGNQANAQAAGDAPKAPTAATSVTLLVTPEQAEAVQLVMHSGRPWLVLRGTSDKDVKESTGVTVVELRGEARDGRNGTFPVLAPPSDPAMTVPQPVGRNTSGDVTPRRHAHRRVTVIRGTAQNDTYFDDQGNPTDASGLPAAGADPADPFRGPSEVGKGEARPGMTPSPVEKNGAAKPATEPRGGHSVADNETGPAVR
jgi:pilus assembly protein CpaB